MVFSIVTWLILSCSALELVYLLYLAWSSTRVPKLVLGDVIHFLYPVDSSLLALLVDPAADFQLRWSLSPRGFREEQRRRMRLYRELLGRMSHNSAVLAEFDNAVRGKNNLAGPESKLQEAAVKVRLYCMFSRGKLRLWLWLPSAFSVVAPPKLAHLRIAASLDGLKVYEELKLAAAEAFAQLQPAELEALTHNL
ncbi:MAG: hypothetical protein WAN65_10005 [Candidatus Sulfotelmatobacter sp.]